MSTNSDPPAHPPQSREKEEDEEAKERIKVIWIDEAAFIPETSRRYKSAELEYLAQFALPNTSVVACMRDPDVKQEHS